MKNTSTKYPDKFTLKATGKGGCEIDHDYSWNESTNQFTTSYLSGSYSNTIEHFDSWIANGWYELVVPEPKLKYPHKFSYTHVSTTQKYDMTYTGSLDYWYCTDAGKEPTKHSAQYNSVEIEGHFARGDWKVVTDEDESVPQERELVLPLVVQGDDQTLLLTQGSLVDHVDVITSDYVHRNLWTHEECKEFIKSGTWVVLSVGPQQPAEAPTSDDKTLSALAIKVGAEEALEQIKGLSEVMANLTKAVEKLSREIKLVTNSGSAMYVRER